MNFLAQISGDLMVHALFLLLIFGVILAMFWVFVCWWNPPEPWKKMFLVILALCGLILVVNCLLTLAGHPLIRW